MTRRRKRTRKRTRKRIVNVEEEEELLWFASGAHSKESIFGRAYQMGVLAQESWLNGNEEESVRLSGRRKERRARVPNGI